MDNAHQRVRMTWLIGLRKTVSEALDKVSQSRSMMEMEVAKVRTVECSLRQAKMELTRLIDSESTEN